MPERLGPARYPTVLRCSGNVQTQPRRYAGVILWRDQHLEDAAHHETAFEHIVVIVAPPTRRATCRSRLISGGDISAAVVAAAAEAALGRRLWGLADMGCPACCCNPLVRRNLSISCVDGFVAHFVSARASEDGLAKVRTPPW